MRVVWAAELVRVHALEPDGRGRSERFVKAGRTGVGEESRAGCWGKDGAVEGVFKCCWVEVIGRKITRFMRRG